MARVAKILVRLDEMYPAVTCALHHSSAWELLVATILSAQCTDKRVNEVTPGLFRKYPTIRDFAAAKQEEMAQEIRSTGFFNNKAKSVIGAARKILADYNGEVPREMERCRCLARRARPPTWCWEQHLGSRRRCRYACAAHSRRSDLTKATEPVKIERFDAGDPESGFCSRTRLFTTAARCAWRGIEALNASWRRCATRRQNGLTAW
jgi:endonuclease-3